MASGYPSNDKIAEANRQINEVKGIMQENIEKAIRREDNLQHLNDKTEELAASSYQFKRNATTLKKQMWWKNVKFTIMLSVICVVILILVIVIPICVTGGCGGGGGGSSNPTPTPTTTAP